MSTQLNADALPDPAVAGGAPPPDELEPLEAAEREIRGRLAERLAESNRLGEEINSLWARLFALQHGLAQARRSRSRGFALDGGGFIYGIERVGED